MSVPANVYRRQEKSPTEAKMMKLPHLKKIKYEENIQKLQKHENRE